MTPKLECPSCGAVNSLESGTNARTDRHKNLYACKSCETEHSAHRIVQHHL